MKTWEIIMKNTIEIISHPLCPFAQRLVLIALAKGWQRDVDFKVTYLDFRTFPQTIVQYSPAGETPVLIVDGVVRSTSAEHAAEYIDALATPALLPVEPSLRLTVRRREQKVANALNTLRTVFTAPEKEALDKAFSEFFAHLADIDRDLTEDGTTEKTFRMDMAALAPVFSLITFHKGFREHKAWEPMPRLREIARGEVANPMVIASRCPNYGEEFNTFFEVTGSAFPKLVAA